MGMKSKLYIHTDISTDIYKHICRCVSEFGKDVIEQKNKKLIYSLRLEIIVVPWIFLID